MPTLNDDLDKLDAELAQLARGNMRKEFPALKAKLLRLFVRALKMANHPIHERIEQLRQLADRYHIAGDVASLARSRNVWITPKPGGQSNLWPLQLLMALALHDKKMSPQVKREVNALLDLLDEPKPTDYPSPSDEWHPILYITYLRTSLGELRIPGVELYLDDKTLHLPDDEEVKLSPQEATIMRMLLGSPSSEVSHAELKEAGVRQPLKRFSALQAKLRGKAGTTQFTLVNGGGFIRRVT